MGCWDTKGEGPDGLLGHKRGGARWAAGTLKGRGQSGCWDTKGEGPGMCVQLLMKNRQQPIVTHTEGGQAHTQTHTQMNTNLTKPNRHMLKYINRPNPTHTYTQAHTKGA